MDGRFTGFEENDWDDSRGGRPELIGDILADLLAQYQARFPGVKITVVEVPAAI